MNNNLFQDINYSTTHPYKPDLLCRTGNSNIYMGPVPGSTKISRSNCKVYSRDLQHDIQEIKKLNIEHIICMMENHEFHKNKTGNYPLIVHQSGINISQYSIVDGSIPTLEVMHKMVMNLRNSIIQGKNVLIHCMGGVGRTGTLASCFLVYCGFEPELAISFVQERRKGTITRPNQQKFVKDYSEYINNLRSGMEM